MENKEKTETRLCRGCNCNVTENDIFTYHWYYSHDSIDVLCIDCKATYDIKTKKHDIHGGRVNKNKPSGNYMRYCRDCSIKFYAYSKLGKVCDECKKAIKQTSIPKQQQSYIHGTSLMKLKGGIKMSEFELFKKGQMGASSIADNSISIGTNVIGFGKNAQEFINKFNFIEIYFNYETKRVGFKGTDNSLTGFKLQRKGTTGHIDYVTGSFVKKIPKGRYDWIKENDFMVIEPKELGRTPEPTKPKVE